MIKQLTCIFVMMGLWVCGSQGGESSEVKERGEEKQMKVIMKTSMGDIEVALNAEKAPKTVENFLQYGKAPH